MTKPVRIRLSRQKGFKLQNVSQDTNGLIAVNVTLPGRWCNPYRIYKPYSRKGKAINRRDRKKETDLHREFVLFMLIQFPEFREALCRNLRDKNLACWCSPNWPCHADTLLELANQP